MKDETTVTSGAAAKPLLPAAERALEEAAKRKAALGGDLKSPKELGGRNGPDPVRYGDWEVRGIACDF